MPPKKKSTSRLHEGEGRHEDSFAQQVVGVVALVSVVDRDRVVELDGPGGHALFLEVGGAYLFHANAPVCGREPVISRHGDHGWGRPGDREDEGVANLEVRMSGSIAGEDDLQRVLQLAPNPQVQAVVPHQVLPDRLARGVERHIDRGAAKGGHAVRLLDLELQAAHHLGDLHVDIAGGGVLEDAADVGSGHVGAGVAAVRHDRAEASAVSAEAGDAGGNFTALTDGHFQATQPNAEDLPELDGRRRQEHPQRVV